MRYPLLLMELLSATPESHPDKAPLTAAVLAVKEINVNINEYKRRKDLGEPASQSRAGEAPPEQLGTGTGRQQERCSSWTGKAAAEKMWQLGVGDMVPGLRWRCDSRAVGWQW